MRWLGVLLWMPFLVQAGEAMTGRLEWADLRRLSVLASAPVTRINVHPGQRVKAGEVLLETDASLLKARLAEARAALAEQAIRRAEAQREYERNQALFERTVLSEHDLRLAETAWKAAIHAHARAKAELIRWERALAWSRITAPADGRIVAVDAAPGEMIQSACGVRPLIQLAVSGTMAVVFEAEPVPEEVEVLAGGGRYGARCQAFRGRARCLFQAGEGLWPGMSVRVEPLKGNSRHP